MDHSTSLRSIDPTRIENEEIGSILRGEISAVEAYEKVINEVASDPHLYRMNQFKLNHLDAVQFWKREARTAGTIPSDNLKIWRNVVEGFIGVSTLLGEESALSLLKRGEEYGLSVYENLLEKDEITPLQKREIRTTFIPRQKRHINVIEELIAG